MARKALIQFRRDTAANWTSVAPTLAAGEIGFETDTKKFKIGDGSTAWGSLPYAGAPLGSTSGLIVKTTTGGALTTLAAGTTSQYLRGDGTYQSLAVGSTSGLIVKTTTSGALTTLAAGSAGQFLQYDGTWAAPTVSGYVSQTNGTVTTASTSSTVVRNITLSTSNPSGGMDGDVWMVYS